ncbi:MAG: hypothetical protein JO097_10780 [Acidobacteriaceae bacterium]|nr:hypothetical protein [Acidobacteriaceae bacterium]MBV9293976.1 hypothetical protein [Acidobacteriaceae bacterium]
MQRSLGVLSLLILLPLALPASEFDWLVREFSRESGARQTHIPLFGLVRFAVAASHPAGTSELRLAIFEHANLEPRRFGELTDALTDRNWKPMVRVRSRNGESTNIYAQTDGKNLRLLITSLDRDDATFVQVRVRPEQLMKLVDDHTASR